MGWVILVLQMESISSVWVDVTGSFQGVCPHYITVAMSACNNIQEFADRISAQELAALNAAVDPVLEVSAVSAEAYCKTMEHLVYYSHACERNMVVAGMETVERIVLAMSSHLHTQIVQEVGAMVLGCFAWDTPQTIAHMLALGCPGVLYAASDAYIASGGVQGNVCYALTHIARCSPVGKAALCSSRGAEMALRAKAADCHYNGDILLNVLSDA